MSGVASGRQAVAAAVRADPSTLRGEVAGSDSLYTISLEGSIDERWIEACRRALSESAAYRRFRFDPASATVLFSCRTADVPALVFESLERLERLIADVNRRVEVWRSHPAVASNPRPLGFV